MSRHALAPVIALTLLAAPPGAQGQAAPAQPAGFAHGPRTSARIALTFDACTTPGPSPYDPRIAAELESMHVPATIFVGGGWAREEAT